jgi:hypothetical protein
MVGVAGMDFRRVAAVTASARHLAEARQRAAHRPVVGAVGRRRDEGDAVGSRALPEPAVIGHGGVRRGQARARHGRKALVVDMHMAVAGER